MLINHLKTARRNMLKRKEFSILNILGLSIGMAACLLILQYVQYETSYDKFHPEVSQLYRMNLGMTNPDKPGVGVMATNHPAAGPSAKADFPQIEEFTRLVDVEVMLGSSIMSYTDESGQMKVFYQENMFVTDSTFFDVFAFPLLAGNPVTALSDPSNVVITESLAKKYFANEDPMGKTLSLQGNFKVKVTGVMKDIPENSHLKISALFSMSVFQGNVDNTWIWPEFYTYLKLAPNTDVGNLEPQFKEFVHKYLGEVMEEFGIEENMYLQQITDIHLDGNLAREAKENGDQQIVAFLTIIAIMILLIAWINYVNLSTARSLERASEVGIRKVLGAGKTHLISQFLVESAVMNILAITISVIIVYLTASSFNQLVGKNVFEGFWLTGLWTQKFTWVVLLLFLVGGTFLAGMYPALVLSSFEPIKTLKSKFYGAGQKISFRQVMVVFQFAISLLMITGTLIVFKQLSFMREQQLGFNMDQMLVVKSPSVIDSTYVTKEDYFERQILQQSSIEKFTASSDIPGHVIQQINSIKKKGQSTGEAIFAYYIYTDEQFLPTYEIDLIAGRNFSKEMATDNDAVILNEEAVKMLGYGQPEDVLGKVISIKEQEWREVTVVGVAENINHRSLAHE